MLSLRGSARPPTLPLPPQDFVELWSQYDDSSNAIDPADLEALLRRLPPPMGLGPHATEADIMRFVFRRGVPVGALVASWCFWGWCAACWRLHHAPDAPPLCPPGAPPPPRMRSLDIPLDDRGLVPFHRTAYDLVVRCTAAEIPEGELKRRLDRMIRRFLARHTPAPREHMNFQAGGGGAGEGAAGWGARLG